MRNVVLRVLKQHFKQYNDYKLGKIADDIILELGKDKKIIGKNCYDCIYRETLITTYIGDPPNLCQKGIPRGDAINCPYYTKDNGLRIYGGKNSSFTRTL